MRSHTPIPEISGFETPPCGQLTGSARKLSPTQVTLQLDMFNLIKFDFRDARKDTSSTLKRKSRVVAVFEC